MGEQGMYLDKEDKQFSKKGKHLDKQGKRLGN